MNISPAQVKELREKTGVGMMDCKKALVESSGDVEQAIQLLRERGIASAAKKQVRSTQEGRIFTYTDQNKGAILELNCETDFVATNDAFKKLGNTLVEAALRENIQSNDALQNITIGSDTVNALIIDTVQQVGENISIGKINQIQATDSVVSYIHSNGKIGVLLGFNGPIDGDLGKDIAMQIAATNPLYKTADEVPEEDLNKEKEILRNQALKEGKPEQIVDKIIEGRINKYYKEVCLLEQTFVKDADKTIKQLLPSGTEINTYYRFSLVN